MDCIVVGAGVAGLAIGAAAAQAGLETLVLERGNSAGRGVSERNSGVVHAGLYYPADSLKTRLCLRGNALMYEFCEAHGVPVKRTGKWVVATTDAEVPRLRTLQAHAHDIGLKDVTLVDQGGLQASEPALAGVGALWSPTSGIVDVPSLIKALEGGLQRAGGALVLKAEVTGIRPHGKGLQVTAWQGESYDIHARFVVNAAGLSAQDVARGIAGLDPRHIPAQCLSKGTYFSYRGKSPFGHLVYPLPEPGGLGVHATLDLAGALRFGPDVAAVETLDYRVDPARKGHFVESIRRYFPDVDPDRLKPDYAGIRPKIVPADQSADFLISGPRRHGLKGLINIFGYESPGLTASLALGEWLADVMRTPQGLDHGL